MKMLVVGLLAGMMILATFLLANATALSHHGSLMALQNAPGRTVPGQPDSRGQTVPTPRVSSWAR
jgi:hypothetical protein